MTTARIIGPAAPARRPRSRRRAAALGCVLALCLGVGASQAHAVSPSGSEHTGPARAAAFHGPPDVRLTNGTTTLSMHPYGACWSDQHRGLCYDGAPPSPLASLGGTSSHVRLAFPRTGWHFRVASTDAQGSHSQVRLIPIDSGVWRLDLSDLADGRYSLDIFGRGSQGDVAAAAALTLT